ncbi:hypothetical protein MKY37_15270 [Psychrobacillus sp. FSL K6-2836]|uniref:hypothetical protein n=1 Tax=Psychrobacillus sp. FSL K6-2836 TaxID=2921548 RepID=UPI0030F7939C
MEVTREKKYRNLLVYLFIIIFGLVTYSLDLYPGGYQLDYVDAQSITITKIDIIQEEQYKIELTEENALKFALLKSEIIFLKTLWLMGIVVFSTWFISISNLVERKEFKPALIISGIFIVIFVMAIFVYIDRLNFLKKVIGGLLV